MHDTSATGLNHLVADGSPPSLRCRGRTAPRGLSLPLNVPRSGDQSAAPAPENRRGSSTVRKRRQGRAEDPRDPAQPCFVSPKIFEISSILASSRSATARSIDPFV